MAPAPAPTTTTTIGTTTTTDTTTTLATTTTLVATTTTSITTPPPTTTTTLPTTGCVDPTTGLETTAQAIRVKRFSLSRVGETYDLRATGRFPAASGLDLTVAGLTLSIEDAAGRRLFEKVVRGADLVPTRVGWSLAQPIGDLPSLDVDPGTTSALVTMRAVLPRFDLVDASGTATGGSGQLRWLVRFGNGCPAAANLSCTTTAEGGLGCALQ